MGEYGLVEGNWTFLCFSYLARWVILVMYWSIVWLAANGISQSPESGVDLARMWVEWGGQWIWLGDDSGWVIGEIMGMLVVF